MIRSPKPDRGGDRLPVRRKTAALIAFPAHRRRGFVRRQALRMATMTEPKAQAYMRQQLAIQADMMRRRGFDEGAVSKVVRGLESAIRAELFGCILRGPQEPA
jgi:uncharacterized membrane protein